MKYKGYLLIIFILSFFIMIPTFNALEITPSIKSVKLNIEKDEDASGYQIYRKVSGGSYSLIKTITDSDITTYRDKTLLPNKTYYYKVRSYKKTSKKLSYSSYEYESTKLLKPTPPVITSIKSTTKSITVNYEEVNSIDGYEIYRKVSGGKYSLIKTLKNDITYYKDSNVLGNKTYYYKVRSYKLVNGVKNYSSYSNILSSKLDPPKSPIISISKTTYNSITIKYDKVSNVSGYSIYRSDSEDGTYKLIDSTTNLTYKDTHLTYGKTYYYKVKSYKLINGNKNYSDFSNSISAKVRIGTPTISVSKVSNTSAKITIKKVSFADGYLIYRNINNSDFSKIETTNLTTYTNSGLSTSKVYGYKVKAFTYIGGVKKYSDYSQVVYFSADNSFEVVRKGEDLASTSTTYSKEELMNKLIDLGYSKEDVVDMIKYINVDYNVQAINKAKELIKKSPLSYNGLVEVLVNSKFTIDEAKYAASNAGIDYKEEAVKSIKLIKDLLPVSKSTLISLLIEEEKYSESEVEYAINKSGVDFNEEALSSLRLYLESNPYSKTKITEILTNDKYTDLEIEYAINKSEINFNEEALRSKRKYKESNASITNEELTSKLTNDGYTSLEISYALEID